ncbi:MAG: hypothetical protein GX575_31900 [Candidatus Anammoximicrobium sp.]|nr:hypothetical protein [Candidatus Anammoximicrobium sp.]
MGQVDPTGKWTLGSSMMTGAIIGGLAGMTFGAVYGARKTGTVMGTLGYASLGLVLGATAGAAIGGGVYLGAGAGLGHLGRVLFRGAIEFWTKVRPAANSGYFLLHQHSRSFMAFALGFGAGAFAGVLHPEWDALASAGGITTFTLANEFLVGGAIHNRALLGDALFGASGYMAFVRHAHFLFRWIQPATFIGSYFTAGFTVGYAYGYGVRSIYDHLTEQS